MATRFPTAAAPPTAVESTTSAGFDALSESLQSLAHRGQIKRFRKGQRLIEEGELGDTIFILLSGRVRVFGSSVRDDREITYGTYGAGEYIGELSLDGGPRSASAEAIESGECVIVNRASLLAHISAQPEFALELLAKVIHRARTATDAAKRLALNDVYGRLVLLLNELAVPQPDGTRLIAERMTHRDLANRLGCSREMVSRLMKDLEDGGYRVTVGGTTRLTRALPTRW